MTSTERAVTVYRTTYRVTDDGHGGSMVADESTDVTTYPCTGSRGVFHESPAREAVGYITHTEYLGTLEGADWFGTPEPYSHPYRDEHTETTAHLTGDWSDTERVAIARMVAWLETRDERTAREYASRYSH